MKSIRHLAISLILATLLVASIPSQALAASDSTTVGTLSLVPTCETISVYSNFAGDDNGNNQATLEYREAGGEWKPGIAMTPDRRPTWHHWQGTVYENEWKNQWRSVIFWLQPDKEYEVKVTYTDTEGVTGSPVTATVRTNDDNPPSNGDVYYVSPTGNDGNPGTLANPFLTIQHAVSTAQAGAIIRVLPGTYNEEVVFSGKSGAPDNYITLESYDQNDKAVIDGQSTLAHNIRIRNGSSYLRVKGLQLQYPASTDGRNILIEEASHDIIIEDNVTIDPGTGWGAAGIFIRSAVSGGPYPCYNLLIQGNSVYNNASNRYEAFGIWSMSYDHYAIVVRNNHIIGNAFKDGIAGDYTGGCIHDNYIEGFWDDGMETEGYSINEAIWGNTIECTWPDDTSNGKMVNGIAPTYIGPVYLFRNIGYKVNDAGLKAGNDSTGYVFLYHNTLYVDSNAIGFYGNTGRQNNIISRNNIYHCHRYVIDNSENNPEWSLNDWDYDNMFTEAGSKYIKWHLIDGVTPEALQTYNIEEFRQVTADQAAQGVGIPQAVHSIEADSQFVDPDNLDLSLQSTSPCIDAGVVLPSFNDANSPWPYVGSAPDMGAYEYGWIESVPPYTSGWDPAKGATDVYPNTNIVVHVKDDDSGVDQGNIVMTVEGATVTPTITGTASDYTLTYNPPDDFDAGDTVNVIVDAQDLASPPNTMQDAYSFTIIADAGTLEFDPAIGDKTIAEGEPLEFTVNAADSDGGPLPLTYSLDNEPSGASINPTTGVFSWTPDYDQAGSYTGVHFEVTDGMNNVYENITITVTNTNRPPQADAGPDQLVLVNSQVTLDGSGSSDPDNDDITYAWTKTSGPTITLSGSTTAAPTFTPTEVGTYVFSLVVKDEYETYSDPDSVTIDAITNDPPVLDSIGDRSVVEGELLEFTVNATDADGPLALTYSLDNEPSGASINPTTGVFSWTPNYDQAGSYTDVHFEVTDGVNSVYENITITVTNVNGPPQANAGPDQQVIVDNPVTLDGSGSSDPDNDDITYAWTQTGGPAVTLSGNTTAAPTFTPTEAGSYVFSLVVKDEYETYSDPDSVTITALQWPYLPFRVNCAGAAYTDSSTNVWQADQSYVSGGWGFYGEDQTVNRDGREISGTEDDPIYTSERYGDFGYKFDLGDGTYDVTLHFNEMYRTDSGERVFDILIEGEVVLHDLDIYSEVGANAALQKTFSNIVVQDGQLNIDFATSIENPLIDGIEISEPTSSGGDDDGDDGGDNGSNSGSSGGSGGGGGGGGGLTGNTNVTQSTTSEGRFTEDVTAESVDGKVELNIPDNTIGLNRVGQRLNYVSIKEKEPPPNPPEDGEIIGLVYEFGPSGTTFDPSITLTFNYDDAEVPAGVAEKNLVLAIYDWDTGQWQVLECVADPENNIVIAQVSHFSTFAVLAYTRPASFEITDFLVTPQEADFGEAVSISILITNAGDLTESHEVSLELDDEVVETKKVTLDGGDSETVSFSALPETAGEHKAGIGDLLAIFTVKEPEAPAAFTISELNIAPTEVNLGDSVTIDALVSNTGDLAGSYEAILKMDDIVVQSKEVTLIGGDSVTINFNVTPDTAGEHELTVNGLAGTFEVKAPPSGIGISSFNISPIYDTETGKLVSTRIDYQINEPEELGPEAELALKVFFEGELLEEIPPLSLSRLQSDGNTGSLGYMPALGWRTGVYTFQAELYVAENSVHSTEQRQFTVTPETVTKAISWKTLGVVVGASIILIMVVVALIIYRRRDMLRDYVE